jgi:hypothetical protein
MWIIWRFTLALLLCLGSTVSGRADEAADRTFVAFRDICLARPDTVQALDALATAQGFTRDDLDLAAIVTKNPAEQYKLLVWRLGEGDAKIELHSGSVRDIDPATYQLSCSVSANNLLPSDIVSALQRTLNLGEPSPTEHSDSPNVTFGWKTPEVGVVYNPHVARQPVGFYLIQHIPKGKSTLCWLCDR